MLLPGGRGLELVFAVWVLVTCMLSVKVDVGAKEYSLTNGWK